MNAAVRSAKLARLHRVSCADEASSELAFICPLGILVRTYVILVILDFLFCRAVVRVRGI